MSDKKSSNIDVKKLQQSMMGSGRKNMQEHNQNKKQNQNNRYTNKKEKHGPKEKKENNNKGTGHYVGAPYNFVPFSSQVYEYPKEKEVKQNTVSDELLTGEILYEITAKTPIMVDDGTEHFHQNPEGKFSIPGSTMRGLIRNNVQILGFSSFYEDIDDYALMYRNVASGAEKEKERYNNTILGSKPLRISDGDKSYAVGILLNVKAGYLFNEHGKYVIYQNCINSIKKEYEGMNYYALSERKIVQDYLKSKKNGTSFCYDFFLQDGKSRMQHEFKAFKRDKKNGRVHYTGTENGLYKPYYEKVSYEIANQKDVTAVGKPGKYKQEGYVMCTGKMKEKKVIYIIPQIDKNKKSIEILEKDVKAFKIDIEKRKNTLKQFGGREFFDLPKEGEMKPVFYIELNGRLYFGFTPRLRLFYDHTILDGLNKNHKEGIMDYSKAIFGYSNKKGSCRSKVSFSDAVIWNTDVKEMEEEQYILSEPKPTSYLDYLEQPEKKDPSTYNDNNLKLRGVKQYWLHSDTVPNKQTSKNKAAVSKFHPLPKETKFEGKVRFRNMTRDELGLLLWSMQLEENSQMNIGKAKAYGYGNIKLSVKEARCINKQKAYQTECLTLNPLEKIEIKPLIDEYKAEIQKFLGSKELMEWPNIRDFFNMKDVTKIPDEDTIKYMSINNKDYQKRKKALPKVGDVIKNNASVLE